MSQPDLAPAGQPAKGAKQLWKAGQPWVSLFLRLGLAAVAFWAAIPKLMDLDQSKRAVYYYDLFPLGLSNLIGIVVPVVEMALGIVLVAGLLTRYSAAVFGLMMVVYIVGIAQAWARGLDINCGCFDPGGPLQEGQQTAFGIDILRDIGLAAAAAVLMIWPSSPASLDKVLRLDPTL